jgi:hypothetical protein
MTIALLLVRRFELPLGSLTVLLGATSLGVTFIRTFDAVFLIGVMGGVVGDALLLTLRPSAARPLQARVLATVVPVVVYTAYFTALSVYDGLWWPVHLWTGSMALAGITGWLTSLVVIPATHAAAPAAEESRGDTRRQVRLSLSGGDASSAGE